MKIAKNLIQQNETIIDPVLESFKKSSHFSKERLHYTD
jgi:hypothetical protein